MLNRFALLLALICLALPASAATAVRSGQANVVAPYYVSAYTLAAVDAEAVVVPLGLAECGMHCTVIVTPGSATTTALSLSNGRFKGQTLVFAVTGANTFVIPTSLTNVDFGSAGDLSITEASAGVLTWDGTDWRRVGVTSTASSAELSLLDGVTSSTAELNILDGVTATATELNQYVVTLGIADLDANATYYVVLPHAGTIDRIDSVIHSAIGVGDATITCNIGATPITGGAITIANAGSAAGDVDTVSPSAAKTVTAGQAVNCAVTGSNIGAARATLSFTVTR